MVKGSKRDVQLSVKVPRELRERLDAVARRNGFTRAAVLRQLVYAGLGDDESIFVTNEVISRMSLVVRRSVGRALSDLFDGLPDLVDEEIHDLQVRTEEGPGARSGSG